MNEVIKIHTDIIKEAVYNLCVQANILYPENLYKKLLQKNETQKSQKLQLILKNIKLAKEISRPLCQDTGQVIVFLKTGRNIVYTDENIDTAINAAVSKAYKDNYFRKSVVKNALTDRENTFSNTPAIIYHEFSDEEKVVINILIKGAGAENYSKIKMFRPSDSKEKIFKFIKEAIENAGEKACPPLVLGIGAGGTTDKAALLSKKAFFETLTDEESKISQELENYLGTENVLEARILTSSTHIASLPVAVTLNCHCTRHACAEIINGKIAYGQKNYELKNQNSTIEGIRVNTDEIQKIRDLKPGTQVLLSGEIFTARDAAHAKLLEKMKNSEELPFELKNRIIFYAGPCPKRPGEITGPVGPTTSARMDKFCGHFYSKGLLASIGKGERSQEAIKAIKACNGKYFSAAGGISCVLAQSVIKSELIAFEELGAEAVYKLTIEDFPLTVEL